jgi:polysaccharide export outer membrane protein
MTLTEISQDVRVEASGDVHLALLGDVKAANTQPDTLARKLEADLKSRGLITAPHVTVAIKEFTTQGVTIEGEVQKPGLYPVYSARNIVDVLALAGGVTANADAEISIQRHGTDTREVVDLPQTNANRVISSDVRVYPGDTVIVPRAGLAYVMGNVTRPGGYIMRDDGKMTVLEAISEAQGLSRDASDSHVILLRKTADGTQITPIQLKAMMRGKVPDVPLQTGDIVFVPSSGLKSFGTNTAGIFASISGAALYAGAAH